ncbi:LacI family DNA-binding transcriptional regulator [Novosphingobium colocasiae]|uniref:LacI family transcriptional regulator n=1 Tax=Novosphingobium colocasiae TaxID=1256513 RepID=A0A918PDQ4_9SPHN|nr:LacI family DNA-binding transcriptional regulator [Novosphingobium colocasiae]GGZ01539.1 LacI family transcriptional regulator [Novosphingobium colocasiae]
MSGSSQRITINDIARMAGVSKKTVSRVINNSPLLGQATRDKVAAVIAQTGFVPNAQARALALRRNFLVALAHDSRELPLSALTAQVACGIEWALAGGEYALLLQPIPAVGGGPALAAFLDRHHPAAIVLPPPLSQDSALTDACAHAGVACIRLGPGRDSAGKEADDRAAMAGAVDWLVAAGHTRIGLVAGPDTSLLARERELGFLDAMADHRLDRGAMLIEPGDLSFASGVRAGRLLLAVSPRPTAILACDDAMAAGVLRAASEAEVAVPAELSVIGFDDTPLAEQLTPPLASIAVSWDRLACDAVRAALRLETQGDVATGEIPPPTGLIVRGSADSAPDSQLKRGPALLDQERGLVPPLA